MRERLTIAECLPVDRAQAALIGRMWSPAQGGPTPVLVRDTGLYDLSRVAPTVQGLLEQGDPVGAIRRTDALPRIGEMPVKAVSCPLSVQPARKLMQKIHRLTDN